MTPVDIPLLFRNDVRDLRNIWEGAELGIHEAVSSNGPTCDRDRIAAFGILQPGSGTTCSTSRPNPIAQQCADQGSFIYGGNGSGRTSDWWSVVCRLPIESTDIS